jgi:small subunit ribosomal protein S1
VEELEQIAEAVQGEAVVEVVGEVVEEVKPLEEVVGEVKEAAAVKVKGEVKPLADFDWEAYEQGEGQVIGDKGALMVSYEQTLNTVNDNDVIVGKVTSMNKREVVVNVGYKSEGVVSISEFRYNTELKVGDEVEVYIESQEDKKGQLQLSHRKARAVRAWDKVNEALATEEIVRGFVKCRTKGGMIVDVFGIEAFLPGSQIDVRPIRDYDIFVGKTMEFKVVKINQEYKNVVVSHKALIEAELEEQKREIISHLERGQVLEGVVKNITSYGVFVDLGGVDGLVHITDLSWGRVGSPEEVVTLDQKIHVAILDFDDEKRRIALGVKQLTPHPWEAVVENLTVGTILRGKVTVVADYGAFVEVYPGVEGLIHVSEMSWTQHLRSAQNFLKVGEEVDAVILHVDAEERKLSLGMKQLKEDPWKSIQARFPMGSIHKAKVKNFTSFGIFVEVEEGVEGLVHISDLSWTKKVKHPSEFTQVGEELEVKVLDIDVDSRRLSLGHKQIEENPWDVFETLFSVGSIHEGTIVDAVEKGVMVSLPYGVEGFATPRHLVKVDGSVALVDEVLPFKVIEFNRDARRIILSHSRIHEDEQRKEKEKERGEQVASSEPKESKKGKGGGKKEKESGEDGGNGTLANLAPMEKTTLGDIEQLAALKDKLLGQEQDASAKVAEAAAEVPKAEEAVAEMPKAEEVATEVPKAESDLL